MWVRDQLDGLWHDEDFADWYPRGGRPGLSPAPLTTVCVLQFLLRLPDRQAAEAVRCRIDFKYTMELDASKIPDRVKLRLPSRGPDPGPPGPDSSAAHRWADQPSTPSKHASTGPKSPCSTYAEIRPHVTHAISATSRSASTRAVPLRTSQAV